MKTGTKTAKENVVEKEKTRSLATLLLAEIVVSGSEIQARRRAHFTDQDIDELAGSVKANGVIQPITVRPNPWASKDKRDWEIVCGERRYLASKKAGLEKIDAVERQLTDDQVLEIQATENVQRKDLDPLIEAYCYKLLQERLGCDVKELALRFGKSDAYVLNRLKLNQLIPEAQEDIEAGHLPLTYALELAKYPAESQTHILKNAVYDTGQYHDRALGKWITPKRGEKLVSFPSFQTWIKNNILYQLSTAVFDLKATNLRADGLACVECPSRTGAAASLFKETGKKDSCLNPACFRGKIESHVLAIRDRLAEESSVEPHKIPIVDSRGWSNEPLALAGTPVEVIGANNAVIVGEVPKGKQFYNSSKKACPKSTAAIDVDKDNYGHAVTVCLRSSACKIHFPTPKGSVSIGSSKSAGTEKTAKEKDQFYQRKEEIWNVKVGEEVRKRVFASAGATFAKTFSVKGGGATFVPALCAKLLELYFSDYTKRRVRDIAKAIVAGHLKKDDLDLSGNYNDGGAGTEKKVAGLSDEAQKLMLYVLIHGHKGDMGQGVWVSQKAVIDIAEEWKIDYRLIDAEVRLELSSKKHQDAHKLYLDAVRAGKKNAARPSLYSEKWKESV
jgi:ParB/RepB/Spo0J family partition protein